MDIVQMISDIDAFVWGPPMIVLLLGSHLYLTIRTRFIQRKLPTAIKLSVTKDPDAPGDISQFGALTTALSATIGTGNIVGVGTAILAGGPGAVLWMWLTGVFGMATKYSETFAAASPHLGLSCNRTSPSPFFAPDCCHSSRFAPTGWRRAGPPPPNAKGPGTFRCRGPRRTLAAALCACGRYFDSSTGMGVSSVSSRFLSHT